MIKKPSSLLLRWTAVLLMACLVMPGFPAAARSEGAAVRVGDEVIFGRYEQDNHQDNGPEDIV